jgi:hypothetical protein
MHACIVTPTVWVVSSLLHCTLRTETGWLHECVYCCLHHHAGLDLSKDALIVGFTATPQRTDGQALPFDTYTTPRGLVWGLQQGYLVDIMVQSVKSAAQLGGTCCAQ